MLVHDGDGGVPARARRSRWPGEAAARAAWDARRARPRSPSTRTARASSPSGRPRLANIGDFVIAEEAALRRDGGLRRLPWSRPRARPCCALPGGEVEIEARADRLDQLSRRRLARGGLQDRHGAEARPRWSPATRRNCRSRPGCCAQGAFGGSAGAVARDLIYWRLTGGEQPGEVKTHRRRPAQDYATHRAGPAGAPGGALAAGRRALRVAPASLAQRSRRRLRPPGAHRGMVGGGGRGMSTRHDGLDLRPEGPRDRMTAAARAAKPRPVDAGRVMPKACPRHDASEGREA